MKKTKDFVHVDSLMKCRKPLARAMRRRMREMERKIVRGESVSVATDELKEAFGRDWAKIMNKVKNGRMGPTAWLKRKWMVWMIARTIKAWGAK